MTATLMGLAEQARRPADRTLTLVTLLMVLGGIPRPVPPVFAHTPARAIRQATCAAGVPAPAVCDRVLGVALTVPKGWSVVPREKFPPGYLAFWTLIPGSQEPPSHLVIEPVGLASACTDSQAALAVAQALARTTTSAHPIMQRRSIVAGAPAVYLYDLPATPMPSMQIVVAHRGAVYQLIFPGSARALRPEQWHALASMRFIPRIGPFPHRPDDPFLTTALQHCATVHLQPSPSFPRQITVGCDPAALAIDQRARRLFVVNMGGQVPSTGTVTIVDANTGMVLRTVTVGLSPYAATVAAAAGRIFVSNENLPPAHGTISMLDATSGLILRTIPAGPVPFALPDERTGRVFVLDESGTLTMRDISSGAFLGSTHVPGISISATAMALNEQNGHLFVVSQRPSTLREFDGRALRLRRLLPIAPQNMQAQDVVVDPQHDRLFVVGYHFDASAVTTLALRTGRLIHVTPFSQLIGTVQEDRHTAHLFATGQGPSAQTGTLATLEVRTGAVVRVIPDPHLPGDLVVDERRGRVFVANGDGTIAELRGATGRLVRTFPVSMARTMRSFAGTLAVDPATGRLIVADPSTDSITVLSPSI